MAHARRADQRLPQSAIYAIVVVATTFMLVVIVALPALDLRFQWPLARTVQTDPVVMEAARQWELERLQQSGWVDPVVESGREWERQRKQLSPSS
jgi:hypothetical protein